MKNFRVFFALLLAVSIMVGSFGLVDAAALEITGEDITSNVVHGVTLSDGIMMSTSGARTIVNGMHGGHQRRMVRTSHGTYVVYLSDETEGAMYELSLIRIDDNGEMNVIYQTMKAHDAASCAPYIFCDENENIYMTYFTPDTWDSQPNVEEWISLHVLVYDKETKVVTDYHTNRKSVTLEGWGYTTPVYDAAAGKIYALLAGGAYKEQASLCWFIFDLATMTWEPEQHMVNMPYRNGYMYAFPDNKGGFFYVGCQNRWKESVEHSELIKHNDWVFDQLNLIYVPDAYKNEYVMTPVYEADWSRLLTENLCPNNGCNQHGDVYIDRDGYMHVFSTSEFIVANDKVEGHKPNDRVERKSWHQVFDVSDPANIQCLYKEQMFFLNGTEEDSFYRMRMTETTDGQQYIFAIQDNTNLVEVWKATPKSGDVMGYDYVFVTSKQYARPSQQTLDLTGISNGSLQDNVVELIYGSYDDGTGCDYTYIKADLNPSKVSLNLDDLKVTLTDKDGKPVALKGGEYQFELLNDNDSVAQTVSNLADGVISFDNLVFTGAGNYTYTIRQISGSDSQVNYDTDKVTVKVVVSSGAEGLKVEKVTYSRDVISNTVKVESSGSGSESQSGSASASGSLDSSSESTSTGTSGSGDGDSSDSKDNSTSSSESGSKGSVDTGAASVYGGISVLALAAGCAVVFAVKRNRQK